MSSINALDEVRAILEAQSSLPHQGLSTLPVLPPIRANMKPSTSAGSSKAGTPRVHSRPATTTSVCRTRRIGYQVLPTNVQDVPPTPSISSKPVTPLYPIPRSNIGYKINLSEIDENEVIRPLSSTSTHYNGEISIIPQTFSDNHQLQLELDGISFEIIEEILQKCRKLDQTNTGLLSTSQILKCITSTISDADSIWDDVLRSISSDINSIDYEQFFNVVTSDKQEREALLSLSDFLDSDDNSSVFSRLPSRPSTTQETRERCRVQLMIDVGVIISRNRDIDLNRFKAATEKKHIDVDEFRMLLQIYGLYENFQDIIDRIIDCFLTHDNRFCFSAFIGCLEQIKPELISDNNIKIEEVKEPIFMKDALPGISKSTNE